MGLNTAKIAIYAAIALALYVAYRLLSAIAQQERDGYSFEGDQ